MIELKPGEKGEYHTKKDTTHRPENSILKKINLRVIIPSLTVDEPMSARIPRDNGISGTFLIVLKTLYAGATSKVF